MLARELGLQRGRYTYADQVHRLYGIRPGTVVFEMETAHQLPDYHKMLFEIHTRRLQHLVVNLDRMLGIER